MTPELETKLVEKYPKIFKMVGSKPEESCMAWGLAVGDGWYWLIDRLCDELQNDIHANGQNQVVAAQVKEKFGGLRFYINDGVNGGTERQHGAINFAENLSYYICETCGTTENVTTAGPGWIKSLCHPCREKHNEQMEERLKTLKKHIGDE